MSACGIIFGVGCVAIVAGIIGGVVSMIVLVACDVAREPEATSYIDPDLAEFNLPQGRG